MRGYSPGLGLGDFDGDGVLDVAIGGYYEDAIIVFLNVGNAHLHQEAILAAGSGPTDLTISDFDGDGKPDIAGTNRNGNTVSVFRNRSSIGSLGFGTKIDIEAALTPYGLSSSDFDGDGKPDLVVQTTGADHSRYSETCPPILLLPSPRNWTSCSMRVPRGESPLET